jgi:cytochrome P450
MKDMEAIDFFRDDTFIADPYPYYEFLRAKCPVTREAHHDVVMVTGYEEAIEAFHDNATFSSCNAVTGPFPGFPVPLEGEDVSKLIEQHRDELPFSDQITTMDPPKHTDHRGLLMRLITPKRLKENEDFMWRLADRQMDQFHARGECEFIRDYAKPFAMLVIADLLGVPEADHEEFQRNLGTSAIGSTDHDAMTHSPLEFLYDQFSAYVEDRRREPRDDVLTGLSTATFPDGSIPEPGDVARIAANLFAAGQETTVRLLAAALQFIAERLELQQLLRNDRSRIPNFIEETLRFDGPIKGDFRLSRTPTTIGGVAVPAGTTIMVLNGAANRDPRKFENPNEFVVDRANARNHIAFGFGVHTCPGAPLARAETVVSLERVLDRMADIKISEVHHGPPDARRYEYAPTYILRGLQALHLEYTPVDDRNG